MKEMHRWSSVGLHCWKMDLEFKNASDLIARVQAATSLFRTINENIQFFPEGD